MTPLLAILRTVLVSGRYIVIIAILGTFVSSVALMIYQGLIMAEALTRVILQGTISVGAGKSRTTASIGERRSSPAMEYMRTHHYRGEAAAKTDGRFSAKTWLIRPRSARRLYVYPQRILRSSFY